ncbi:ATP-binding protein [Desulfopila aestuarii]|uniref:MinD superfamily P-loop ATPase, contains an inserted ferredoxin domain n=1 Tax=Desulfopila aestuarii DSM 18488 TaxID=1121416 RepID=A0A1M7Y638_9BACT|nr:ATP-binding protein [Desulfopila aestuarii]SHO47993.1 MinD superfamily P-loop ATPase, contains an inserted ferredoxin domain [Desulfopila aestuarii DSM 18488]
MIVTVASGKGGTGKTTVATSLACAISDSVHLLDCDVEEPNVHIFLHPKIQYQETVYTMVPEVDQERCNGCRKCVDICRFSAITVVGQKLLTFPELCHGCVGCMVVCPENAITEGGREVGKFEIGQRGAIRFGHGLLRIGEAMAPPLIRKVREQIDDKGITIIDAPPGTSCPVITAMRGVDFVLLVTEPTPFGLHDLKLAVEAVIKLGIPCGIVINRSDLGDNGVQDYAQQQGIPVLMEIPFSREIARNYSKGRILAEQSPKWREKFAGLYEKIKICAAC